MSKINSSPSILIFVVVIVFGVVFNINVATAKSPAEAEIQSVVDSWLTAWNNQDKNAVLALFADDAGIAKGKEKNL